jgi:glycosyltransferase involved in cell wall biosynthesis
METENQVKNTKGKHVTVLMAVYNNQAHVAQAIESILNQTHEDFDLVIVDDGSTDSTKEIIQGFALVDERIRLIFNTENLGIPKTRNILLKSIDSNSGYFAILDGDDVSHPERLEKQIKFIEERGIDGCGSNSSVISDGGDIVGSLKQPLSFHEITKTILHFNPFAQSSMMLRKNILDRVVGYDEKLSRCEDYDLWIRVIRDGFVLENMESELNSFRVHKNQGKSKNSKKSFFYSFVVRGRYIFSRRFFSFKGFLIWLSYIPMIILPKSITVDLYRKIFVKNK